MTRLKPIFERSIASGYTVYLNKYIELKDFTGIVYYYASWSSFSEFNLMRLFQSASYNPRIPVYVFELDEEFCKSDLHWEIGRGTGWGDIFWFRDGVLIGKMVGALSPGKNEFKHLDEMNRSYGRKPDYPDESYLENERSCLRHISEDFMPLNDIVRTFSGFNRKPNEEDFSKAMIFLKVFLARNRIRVLMGGDMQECDMTQKELISYIRGEWRNGDLGYAIWFDIVDIDFSTIDYLKDGNEIQQRAFSMLKYNAVMEKLYAFDPVLAGTIPIDINIEGSDLDIICYWQDREVFVAKVVECFGKERGFRMSDGKGAVVANFAIEEFEVELYGDNIPSREQAAYRHMLTEHRILQERGEEFRQAVMQLKRNGMKTEPAFGLLLRLEDPYKELLDYEGLEGK